MSLITALLVHFAQVRRLAYATALGFDDSLLKEKSIPDYLLGSVGAVYFPLMVATVGMLLWLWVDPKLRRWVRGRRAPTRALPVGGAALVLVAWLAARLSPIAAAYVSVVWPFLLALAVLAAAYGASLRRGADPGAGVRETAGRRWAINALIWLLVSLLLFDGVDRFAQVVGRGLAERVTDQPLLHTQPVLLYSAQDLHLDPAAATRQELPGEEHSAYRYRYEGLRLVIVDGGRYFLIGRTWRPHSGTLIVLPSDGARLEFLRGTP
ncbi:MAG: hypothetical protein ACRDRZ_17130 [Pseudonocardiaceae bacterium]